MPPATLLADHDRHLSTGQMCYAKWDHEGPAYRAYCAIRQVDPSEVRVELLERVYDEHRLVHRIGSIIKVPRYGTQAWNTSNCIEVKDV